GAGSGEAPGGGRHRHPGCDLFQPGVAEKQPA
ncbi:hypothetical protein LPJCHP_LPJCHP_04980, partial [Dysosmobacter welbionis]